MVLFIPPCSRETGNNCFCDNVTRPPRFQSAFEALLTNRAKERVLVGATRGRRREPDQASCTNKLASQHDIAPEVKHLKSSANIDRDASSVKAGRPRRVVTAPRAAAANSGKKPPACYERR
ncbi:hypothetical protein LSAT2_008986 [Lamellibrachia satsuma]|nr:hypothetical protein LSAT2_008986 [Lamellibrachia satsuma]